jgi:hypothetical protein
MDFREIYCTLPAIDFRALYLPLMLELGLPFFFALAGLS